MIEKLVRKNIIGLKPYTSARDSYQEGILLDANENSLGSVLSDADQLQLNRYPDPSQFRLREALSGFLGVESKNLFFGVGSDEIIDLLIRIFCEPGKDSVLIPIPTYGMYQVACDINNVEVINVPLNKDFQVDVNKTLKAVKKNTKMIFLCSPNNPTGNVLKKRNVLSILKKFNGIVIIDEAYIDFCQGSSFISELSDFKKLIITRTFSKAWGLAGVRCGYSIADEFIINLLFKVKAPYNINKLTANTVLESLKKTRKMEAFVTRLNDQKEMLIDQMKGIRGIRKILKTDANFITFKVKDAKGVFNYLAKEGIIIRDRSSQLNLENCLRVSVGTPKENKLFLKKLKEAIGSI